MYLTRAYIPNKRYTHYGALEIDRPIFFKERRGQAMAFNTFPVNVPGPTLNSQVTGGIGPIAQVGSWPGDNSFSVQKPVRMVYGLSGYGEEEITTEEQLKTALSDPELAARYESDIADILVNIFKAEAYSIACMNIVQLFLKSRMLDRATNNAEWIAEYANIATPEMVWEHTNALAPSQEDWDAAMALVGGKDVYNELSKNVDIARQVRSGLTANASDLNGLSSKTKDAINTLVDPTKAAKILTDYNSSGYTGFGAAPVVAAVTIWSLVKVTGIILAAIGIVATGAILTRYAWNYVGSEESRASAKAAEANFNALDLVVKGRANAAKNGTDTKPWDDLLSAMKDAYSGAKKVADSDWWGIPKEIFGAAAILLVAYISYKWWSGNESASRAVGYVAGGAKYAGGKVSKLFKRESPSVGDALAKVARKEREGYERELLSKVEKEEISGEDALKAFSSGKAKEVVKGTKDPFAEDISLGI